MIMMNVSAMHCAVCVLLLTHKPCCNVVCLLGLPMKLTYFVGPYDLLNHKTLRPTPMTIEGMLLFILSCLYSCTAIVFHYIGSVSKLILIIFTCFRCFAQIGFLQYSMYYFVTKCTKHVRDFFEYALCKFTLYLLRITSVVTSITFMSSFVCCPLNFMLLMSLSGVIKCVFIHLFNILFL